MLRVLLVLDSGELSAVLHKELSANYEVKICNATTAAEMIDHYQPDALILDLFLPGIDGFQVLQHSHYSIPSIILLTVLVSTDILQQAADQKINYIFLKPFRLSALSKQLNELLGIDAI